ncbi:MAG: ATP-binding protein [Candidatus Moranbacteria bacterium]|nr:ATP-binding protein [Candidatus Moranbacteria bacterium]
MIFTLLVPLLSFIFVIVLGLVVLKQNSKSKLNIVFFLFSLMSFIWFFSTFMMFISGNSEKALFWDRIVYLGVVFIPTLAYHFIIIFTNKKDKKDPLVYLGYLVSIVFSYSILLTDFFVSGLYEFSWGWHSKAHTLHHFFLLFFVFYVLLLFRNIFIFYRKTSGLKKEQAKYMFLGLLALLPGSLGFLPAYGVGIYPFSYLSGLVFVVIIAYAIVRHRLMDVKLVLRKSSVTAASLIVVFGGAGLVKLVSIMFFSAFEFWLDLVAISGAIFAYPYLRDYFFQISNKYFFSSLYDSRKVILKATNKMKTLLDSDTVYNFLAEIFEETFHVKKFGVFDYNEKKGGYVIRYNQGFDLGNRKYFPCCQVLQNKYFKENKAVMLEEGKENYYGKEAQETVDLMDELGIELLVPLNIKKRTVGILALGPKETREMYNEEDLQVLEIIGGQAAISIENAQLYEQVKKFNKKLKKEIKKATADLEKTNHELKDTNVKLSEAYKKLRQLDEAKNEFISIASHQLRTPLTSIKGFISMIMEGDYGEYSEKIGNALRKIYISNERLIKLVNDLLSISRIEAGRFTFNFRKNNLPQMVSKIMDTFELEAKEKNLRLTYHPPEKEMEDFVFDKEKLQEVISNLIDNAVKYTQEGKVEVSVKDNPEKARITVSDSGRGMAGNELEAVFEKFRRGSKSTSVDTEGTGLGLYVCQKIVTAHQGKIWAESDGPGKGSRFIVEIPKDLKPSEGETKKKAKEGKSTKHNKQ